MKPPPRRKKPKDLENDLSAMVYDDATREHFGMIGVTFKEIDLSLGQAKRLRTWLNRAIAWAESREVLPKKGGARG